MKAQVSNKHAMGHPAVVAAMGSMVKVASNISAQYEELRQAIDGGSESMTHEDAIKAVKYWQERDAEIDQWKADQKENLANQCNLQATVNLQRKIIAAQRKVLEGVLNAN